MDSALLTLVALLAPVAAFLVLAIVAPLRRAGRPGAYFSILGAAVRWPRPSRRGAAYDGAITRLVWDWLPSEGRPLATIGVLADETSTVMLVLVALVAFLVQVYSLSYLSDEPPQGLGRYYTYQSLFAFSMMGLVLAPNLLQLFICWELVGLCSYLLIGYWYQKPEAARAAVKAFWTTKAGDVGLLIGIVMLWKLVGHLRPWRASSDGDRQRAPAGRSFDHHVLHLPRSDGQVGAVPAARLAARRHGRAHARLGADSCGDDGDGGCVSAASDIVAVCADARRAADRCLDWSVHRPTRRGACVRAGRHQTRARLLHRLAARLHDGGHRCRLLHGRLLPPADARVVQGVALPRGWRRHSRGRQQRFVADGRARSPHAADGDRLHHRDPLACRHPALCRLPVEGRDPRIGMGGRTRGTVSRS